jgi:hypothetical protein
MELGYVFEFVGGDKMILCYYDVIGLEGYGLVISDRWFPRESIHDDGNRTKLTSSSNVSRGALFDIQSQRGVTRGTKISVQLPADDRFN